MSRPRPRLSAEDILAALNGRRVRYVVIGAFAAIAQGAPIDATYDIDVTPQREPQNLERLSLALSDLDARVLTQELTIHIEASDVPDAAILVVLGVPVASDQNGVVLGQHRVEDRLPLQPGREPGPPGRLDQVQLRLPDWAVQAGSGHKQKVWQRLVGKVEHFA